MVIKGCKSRAFASVAKARLSHSIFLLANEEYFVSNQHQEILRSSQGLKWFQAQSGEIFSFQPSTRCELLPQNDRQGVAFELLKLVIESPLS
jgi:hypothetical protein